MQKDSLLSVIISDNSCLSALIKIDQFDLLKKLYGEITITPEVKDEFLKKKERILPEWIIIREAKDKKRVSKIHERLGLV